MEQYHGTTIISVRRGRKVAMGGDGQVTLGNIVVKASARKVRRIHNDSILAGFETPYRNRQMLQTLIGTCAPATRICVASNLTLPTEYILTRTAHDWKTAAFPDIDKQPTVFLLQA